MGPLKEYRMLEKDNEDVEVASTVSETESTFMFRHNVQQRRRPGAFVAILPWALNAILLFTTLYFMNKSLGKPADPSQLSYSPARKVVEYETKAFHQGFGNDTSPYQGWPNDEIDQRWEDMYSKGVTLHVDAKMHDQLAAKSELIAMPGLESEYLVGLDVFHQLHCLNTIRKAFYPKRYNISYFLEDGTLDFMEWMHIDHCIESIRQSLTCSSDISANNYLWVDKVKHMKPRLEAVHTCRNFEKIKDWAFDRYVDWSNDRLHVENGKIVDYSYVIDPKGPSGSIPPDFHHTKDEFMLS